MRINVVKRARKAPGTCWRCREPIEAGEPYKWIKGRYSPKKVFHAACRIRKSDMTSSDKLARLYDIEEELEATLNGLQEPEGLEDLEAGLEDMATALEEAAENARGIADEYRKGAENQREYFGNTEQVYESEQKADDIEAWADALEDAAGDIRNMQAKEGDYIQVFQDASDRAFDAVGEQPL